MAAKRKEAAIVLSQECIAEDIYSMWIGSENVSSMAVPGQFIEMYTRDGSKLLPRPISLCEIDRERNAVRVVYRVTGKNTGTEIFSKLTEGMEIDVMGPLGNGFPLDKAEGKKAMLIGGGIGVPPMLETAKQLKGEKVSVMGYRSEQFLKEEFEALGNYYIATEDGCAGTKGNVMNAIKENNLDCDVIFACGPLPMLRAIKEYALENNIVCYVSLEEKMACGVGACLGCVVECVDIDDHSHVHNKRVCKDGPVFLSTEVIF